jgi:hypothetical protein
LKGNDINEFAQIREIREIRQNGSNAPERVRIAYATAFTSIPLKRLA